MPDKPLGAKSYTRRTKPKTRAQGRAKTSAEKREVQMKNLGKARKALAKKRKAGKKK